MKIRALGNQVIIRRDPAASVTDAGIAIVETAKERPATGTVVAVGPGLVSELTGNLIPTTLKPLQRVAYPKFAPAPIPNHPDLAVLSERDVLFVFDEGEEVG